MDEHLRSEIIEPEADTNECYWTIENALKSNLCERMARYGADYPSQEAFEKALFRHKRPKKQKIKSELTQEEWERRLRILEDGKIPGIVYRTFCIKMVANFK